jgi:hypothetical protein
METRDQISKAMWVQPQGLELSLIMEIDELSMLNGNPVRPQITEVLDERQSQK